MRGGDRPMKPKTYPILDRAVEEGVERGWRMAHKHTDAPGSATIRDRIADEVMNAICEVFSFDDDLSVP